MNKPPAFQFYAQDFLTGVMYLTNEEVGIYIRMLSKQWTDKKIPKKRLGLLVGYTWENLSEEVKSKFEDKGEYVINVRMEEERAKQNARAETSRNNGKKGGRPPKKVKNQKPNKNLEESSSNEDEDRSMKNEVEDVNEIEVRVWPDFEDFWDAYDKKRGDKRKIRPKWEKLPQETKEYIMAYIPLYKQSQPDKQYRKDPQTFLNNESWNDEIIVKKNLDNKNWDFDAEKVFNSDTAQNIKFS